MRWVLVVMLALAACGPNGDDPADVVDRARADYYRRYWIAGGALAALTAIPVTAAIVRSRRRK